MKKKQRKLYGEINNFDIRLLQVFRAVVENGGFSAAEVELNISRSAISISMSDLEQRLGLRLCQRGRQGFSLTDEGEQVYEASQQLMTSLQNFRTQVNAIHKELKGELSIGITDNLVTLPHMRVTNALKELKTLGPEINVNIRMIPPTDIERGVLDGGIHVGVVPVLKPVSGLIYNSLYDEISQLYCFHQHPLFKLKDDDITADIIKTHDAIGPAYAQIPEIKIHYQGLNTSATATDREGVAFLILSGCYIGYLPTHFAAKWVESGEMRALRPEKYNFRTEYQTVTRKGNQPNLVLETFLSELVKKESS